MAATRFRVALASYFQAQSFPIISRANIHKRLEQPGLASFRVHVAHRRSLAVLVLKIACWINGAARVPHVGQARLQIRVAVYLVEKLNRLLDSSFETLPAATAGEGLDDATFFPSPTRRLG